MALLEVKDLQVYYGVIRALKGISFNVSEGEIVSLIGANGAGKTTTMQSIMGLIPIKSGSVVYDGKEINKIPGHKLVGMGMSQVPEGRRVFQELTVYENLLLGAYTQSDKKKIKILPVSRTYALSEIESAFFAFCSTSKIVVPAL